MNRNELFASIEVMRPGRDEVACLWGFGHILPQRPAP
jgi:hypothetical protein